MTTADRSAEQSAQARRLAIARYLGDDGERPSEGETLEDWLEGLARQSVRHLFGAAAVAMRLSLHVYEQQTARPTDRFEPALNLAFSWAKRPRDRSVDGEAITRSLATVMSELVEADERAPELLLAGAGLHLAAGVADLGKSHTYTGGEEPGHPASVAVFRACYSVRMTLGALESLGTEEADADEGVRAEIRETLRACLVGGGTEFEYCSGERP